MGILDDLPAAPDGREYWLDKRFASLFSWGRPPLPGRAADLLAAITDKYKIRKALVLGSCCQSVLTAVGFGDPQRKIRMIDMRSRWGENYGYVLEDVDDPESYPPYDTWLPVKRLSAMEEWSWSPRLGEMLFVDASGDSPLVKADLVHVLSAVSPRLVALGFMEGHQGPAELEGAMRERGWNLAEATFKSKNLESGEEITYRLVVGENPQPLEEDPEAQRQKELHWARAKERFRLLRKLLDPSKQSTKDEWLSDVEQLRECYRPDHVRLLFVGESPPASGDFFYLGNSKLYLSTASALRWDENWKEALSAFQDAGGYLIDLCHEPIDKLARPAKRAKRKEAEADLAERLQSLAPDAIVIAMRDIEGNVRRAIASAGLPESLPVFVVSFPAYGHQNEYTRDLREIAKELRFMQGSDRAG